MESFATPYPLVFFDGEQEHDRGFVGIHSVLTFKRFQSLLSQKTGISSNQLCAVFVCRKTLKSSEKRQRLPINGSTNFNILLNQHNPTKERDCYFLVSLKRSKKERKCSRKRSAESEIPDDWETKNENWALDPSNHSVDGTLLQDLAGSAEANAISVKSTFAISHTDSNIDKNRNGDNKVGKVILKRGSNPLLQRHGWNHAGDRKSSRQTCGFLSDEHVQLNSPRFAALRPEDQRDLNWKWEDAFPGLPRVKPRDQWEMHDSFTVSHNVTSHSDGGYSPYSPETFSPSFSKEHAVHRNPQGKVQPIDIYGRNFFGIMRDQHARSPSRLRELQNINHSKPGTLAPRVSCLSTFGSKNVTDVQGDRDAFFKGNSHLQFPVRGDERKILEAAGQFSDIQDVIGEEMTHSLFCQLCVECRRRNVTPIPFHWCVEDAVTNGFQGPSPAGPIGRRVKAFHIEAAA